MSRVLVVATSRKTRGGITSVVKAHETGEQWKKFHCRWIETHKDSGFLVKLFYFIKSFTVFLFILPSYNLVHFHLSEPPSALRKVPFMWWAKLWRKKTIVHFHSFSVETTIESKWAGLYKYLFGRADVIVTLSEYWKMQVTRFIGDDEKVKVIYNPCPDVKRCEREENDVESKKQILYAGTVIPRKGYADLISAFAEIAHRHQDWKIVFAGNGEIEKGKALAERAGISSQTEFLGWCGGADIDRVFREASIFCLPSYAEGFSMAVLDAWAYGLPVITTPVGGVPDVAIDNENMLLFSPGDVKTLSGKLEMLIEDEGLRRKLHKASVDLAETLFCVKRIDRDVGKLYEDLIGGSNSAK